MDFSDALTQMKVGSRIARAGWNGRGMWIAVYDTVPIDGQASRAFIYMKTADDQRVPWVASQTDLLADDWEIAQEAN